MEEHIILKVKKSTKIIGWLLTVAAFVILLSVAIIYNDIISEVEEIIWLAFIVLILVGLLLPYLNKTRGIIITDKDITVNLLYKGKPIPLEEIEEVHFISNWGFPKSGRKVLNIDTRLDNRKEAARFLEGKVRISGAENLS